MYFRKPSSITLLARAEQAEATADTALAVVSKARAKAARQRFLAARVEAEETAVRSEKEAISAESLAGKALEDYMLALHEKDVAEGTFLAAQRNVNQVRERLEVCEKESEAATSVAKAARAEVPTTESKE